MYTKKYEELQLQDDFVFAKTMLNPKLCKKLLEMILDVEIERIEYPEEQKVIDISMDARSVRLDVYVRDGKGTIYNIEMQTTNPKNLPKRSRYYQGMIDLNLIEKGEDYNKLNKSFVIFICLTDIFEKGRHIYTFRNLCTQDTKILLEDETTKIFLNPYGTQMDIDEELQNFLLYLSDGRVSDNFTEELEMEVQRVKKNEKWRREYMTLQMRDNENIEKGRVEGRKEGRIEGRKEGRIEGRKEGFLNALVVLVKDGILSLTDAASRADMSEEEFEKLIK